MIVFAKFTRRIYKNMPCSGSYNLFFYFVSIVQDFKMIVDNAFGFKVPSFWLL